MPYILEFDENRYTKNSLISLEKIKDMCESNDEVMTPFCPKCDVLLVCDDQTKDDHIGWCIECGDDYYECEITKYEVMK
jgi:hypothetical protein